ncbi:alpha-D-ribose 1-methylphosphonate 5-triphosphate diphosphatase [Roseinatronobacter thiooxidans]|uniref:Alpha-D-ribose 1-methylphosphonate 5-triphosphate diphosphatase n=1 Tax=Roseinatronobacter thiooxidans TaxID=121821 RepID=A0A2W7Q1H0_9RHOB|nr:alpha-D-ribose 1-methylphosphonate 5-triphosphate diphosphatase [Roseinatronobacter thiooxidans]PZX38017.1 alpha-D-ribose 1-methylphosphonate 5-triphosphate diphosphatase [Roseinatronobacter thiooxidans]
MTERVLANAMLVLPDEIRRGAVVIRDGVIAAIEDGAHLPKGSEDCDGDLIAPGLIELHTDNLERHLSPRPGVDWPHASAVIAHDRELAGTGITTVFDALRIGSLVRDDMRGRGRYARALASEILELRDLGALKISHYLHLRAEICSETLIEEFDEFGPSDRIGIVSLMDHTPGQRQFADLGQLRVYLRGKYGMTDSEFDTHVARQQALGAKVRAPHEAAAVGAARRYRAVLASHDDTTVGQVAASAAHGVRLAEFPTTLEAAEACHAQAIAVMMGAPNLIRGGSHSGNVAASALAAAGRLDILSSDYVPAALLQAAIRLGQSCGDMARGFRAVTAAPANAAGLTDRGALREGLRADVIRVAVRGSVPMLRNVWVRGARVA